MFDSHCHLDFSQFDSDRNEVVKRAFDEGIGIITCAVDSAGVNKTLNFYTKFLENKSFFITFGISPTNLDEKEIKNFINNVETHKDKIIGVGEIGLDYYWVKDENAKEQQRKNFKFFIDLSKKINKKIIVHSRNAENDVIEILKENKTNAVLHCFSGSIEQAMKAIELGCLISISTTACWSKKGQKMIAKIPIEYIVTETDAPFLSPFPERKNDRNEPLNIKYLVKKISEIKNMGFQTVSNITEENLRKFLRF